MTTEELLVLDKVCRVCCQEGNMMSLFICHISRKLMYLSSSIQVWQNDGLPDQICTKCVAKLHIAFQFKKQCEKSDVKLRNQIQQMQENQNSNKFENQNVQISQTNQQLLDLTEQHQPQHTNAQQNDFVYVTTPNIEETSTRHYDVIHNMPSQIVTQQIHHYGDSLNTIQQLPNSYPIQSLQFQTYNVPLQIPQTNHVLALGLTTVSPLQPIITNQNTIGLQPIENIERNLEEKKCTIKLNSGKKFNSNYMKVPIKLKIDIDNSKICQICGKEFLSLQKLSRHLKIHSNEMTYRCHVCSKGFKHSGNFKVHMRKHTNERPYQCTICDKACRQQQDLEKHLRVHTGQKPYECKICQKAFSTSSNLIAHKRIHSGEKPYVCSVCQKAFCQSNELTKHNRVHTGEKSHICKFCKKGFNGSSTLKVHMRSHTGERPYICNICHKGFTQSSCLHVHMKRHKSEKLHS